MFRKRLMVVALLLLGTADLAEARIMEAGKVLFGRSLAASGALIAGPVQAMDGTGNCDVLLFDSSAAGYSILWVQVTRNDCHRVGKARIGDLIIVRHGVSLARLGESVTLAERFKVKNGRKAKVYREILGPELAREALLLTALRHREKVVKHFNLSFTQVAKKLPAMSNLINGEN